MRTDQNNQGQGNQGDQFDDTLNPQRDSSQNTESQSDGQALSGSQNIQGGQQPGNPGQGASTVSQESRGDSGTNHGAGDYGEATGDDFVQSQQGENGTISGNTNAEDGSQNHRSEHNVESSRGGDDGREPEDESSRSK